MKFIIIFLCCYIVFVFGMLVGRSTERAKGEKLRKDQKEKEGELRWLKETKGGDVDD